MRVRSVANVFVIFAALFVAILFASQTLFAAPRKGESIIYTVAKDIFEYHFKDDKFSCDTCHKNVGNKNFQLTRDESELCYDCHSRLDEKAWVHGPVSVGQCSVCHDAHGSKKPNFLTRKGSGLCYFCHNEVRLRGHADEVDSRDCTYCHDSHSGDTNILLREESSK